MAVALADGDALTHAVMENKSGRLGLSAKAFVDAAGDADLCHLAGEGTIQYTESRRSGWYFSRREGEGARLHPLSDPRYSGSRLDPCR